MFGTGLGHFIPIGCYLGFWIMSIVSLIKKPLYGLYFMLPFLPYRTLRDHFLDFPLGANMLTILVIAVILGALFRGKRLPKSKLFAIWFAFGAYLYISMWLGVILSGVPAPLWLGDENFVAWKDYMVIPLVFVAAGLVIEDRKAVRTVLIIAAVSLLLIDRSCILESLTRTYTGFDEDKRGGGPLAYGSNQTAAFLAQFAMLFWGCIQFVKRKKVVLAGYFLVAVTLLATMYTFSRASYIAVLFSVLILGLLKDRKLLIILGVFLVTWQAVVPTPVKDRVNMTKSSNGRLEESAQARVDLWTDAETSIEHDPILGTGFATYQFGQHVDNLKDTHNWYVKVMVETGLIGLIFAILLLQQMIASSYRLFKKATDPLYRGLGLGLLLGTCSCMVANAFGDRWTYLEIMALFWVLIAAGLRAMVLPTEGTAEDPDKLKAGGAQNRYLAYR